MNEQSEDDDDRTHLPDATSDLGLPCTTDPLPTLDASFNSYPSPPDATSTQIVGPIHHVTDICIKVLINSKNKGDFLHLQTSVMVCWVA